MGCSRGKKGTTMGHLLGRFSADRKQRGVEEGPPENHYPEIGAAKEILWVSLILTYSTLRGTKMLLLPLSQGAIIQTETKDTIRPRGCRGVGWECDVGGGKRLAPEILTLILEDTRV